MVEFESVFDHGIGSDFQDDRDAVSLTDGVGGADVRTEVDVLAGHALQAFTFDHFDKARRGAVVEDLWGDFLGELEIDVDGVSLVGADSLAVFGEAEALLAVFGDDFVESCEVDGFGLFGKTSEEFINVRPALVIESESDGTRIVPEDEAQSPADLDVILVHAQGLEGI